MMNNHIFLGSLEALSDEELRTKVSDLHKKLAISRRMSSSSQVVYQIQLLLEDHIAEQHRRLEETTKQYKESDKNNWDGLIDIS